MTVETKQECLQPLCSSPRVSEPNALDDINIIHTQTAIYCKIAALQYNENYETVQKADTVGVC